MDLIHRRSIPKPWNDTEFSKRVLHEHFLLDAEPVPVSVCMDTTLE